MLEIIAELKEKLLCDLTPIEISIGNILATENY